MPELQDEIIEESLNKMALEIISISFQEGNKWCFFDEQNKIIASMEDKEFLSKIDHMEIGFVKNDILICEVRVKKHIIKTPV